MKLLIIPFEPEHVLRVEAREFDLLAMGAEALGMEPMPMAKAYYAGGPAFTALAGEKVVACAGVCIPRAGVGEAWTVTSGMVRQFPFSFVKNVRRILERIVADHGLVRVQAIVHEKHFVSCRWVERMGFKQEGLMRKFIGGENFHLYARVI